MNVSSQYAAEQ